MWGDEVASSHSADAASAFSFGDARSPASPASPGRSDGWTEAFAALQRQREEGRRAASGATDVGWSPSVLRGGGAGAAAEPRPDLGADRRYFLPGVPMELREHRVEHSPSWTSWHAGSKADSSPSTPSTAAPASALATPSRGTVLGRIVPNFAAPTAPAGFADGLGSASLASVAAVPSSVQAGGGISDRLAALTEAYLKGVPALLLPAGDAAAVSGLESAPFDCMPRCTRRLC
ncbi:unnamed protein product [Prorocentrum cordatum]|uniref:Uncharacterized protein n=1 Tax=Prorocentrum cordatum TaxID=2364126 RepID=A0ABN9V086_9DINO|nr:unnamed protein product [Polarella glacialis]